MTTAPAGSSIRFHSPSYDERELEAVRAALAGHGRGDGPIGRRVEARLAELTGASRVLLTHLVHARAGDGALLPRHRPRRRGRSARRSRSCRPPTRPALRGATRSSSTSRTTLNLDERESSGALTPRTSRAAPVHYAGVGCDMEAILDIAQRAICSSSRTMRRASSRAAGRPLGTLGDAGPPQLPRDEERHVRRRRRAAGHGTASWRSAPRSCARRAPTAARFLRGEVDKYTWVDVGRATSCPTCSRRSCSRSSSSTRSRPPRRTWSRATPTELVRLGPHATSARRPVDVTDREPDDHLFYLLFPDHETRDRCLAPARRGRDRRCSTTSRCTQSPYGAKLDTTVALPGDRPRGADAPPPPPPSAPRRGTRWIA